MARLASVGQATALTVALALAGCSGSDTIPVSGTVTFNGQPIPQGVINFLDPDGPVAPASGAIVNGEYRVRVRAGRKKVEVYAHREKPGQQDVKVMGLRAREAYIPPRYNALSELCCVVTPQGPNRFQFDLKGDRKR